MAARLVNQEEPLPGYRLLERLGRGGFGEVWKVEAPGGLLKAMKFVFGDLDGIDDDESRPAEQELKALHRVKSIRHPYILSLERFDKVDGQLIIVMELADQNLWDRFRTCRSEGHIGIPREELLRYMEESAEALDLMNDTYFIQHLDVKPQNIFLVHNHAKVADFGLAKDFGGDRGTITGGVTPVYAAPETFEGWVSRFTDQYSLGIVFQELLTGTRPFNGANTKQLLLQHLNGIPDVTPLPEADRPIIARSLEKKPEDRWKSCTEMVKALRDAGSRPATVGTPAQIQPPRPRNETPRPSSGLSHGGVGPVGTPIRGQLITPGRPGAPTQSPSFRPTPGLVTPQLVTQQTGSNVASVHTLQRPQVFQTGRMNSLGIAPPEREGDGVLFPAMFLAVGKTGLQVMMRLRAEIRSKFGAVEALPHLRFLFLDTDSETIAEAGQGPDALTVREIVPARLNRPAHYMQSNGKMNAEEWLPQGLLYKLPKNPGPAAGVRAFGRLALWDNYRVIAQRIRQEIETYLTDEPLDKAAASSQLGVRNNRPRAYLLAGSSGGTGSGMVIDLAYIFRHELRAVGYRKPEVIGMLMVPPADKTAAKGLGLANTYATLSEVYHYSAGTSYQTRFDSTEPPIVDAEPPFSRLTLVQLPRKLKPEEQLRAYSIASGSLYTETLTTCGRVIDYVRTVSPRETNAPTASLVGMFRLSWPRQELLTTAVRRFSQRLLLRWAAKDSSHLKEPVTAWVEDQWSKHKLDSDSVRKRLQDVARKAMNEDPDAVFDAAVDGLRTRDRTGGVTDAAAACAVLEQIILWVGKPTAENDIPGAVETAIEEGRRKFSSEIEGVLAQLSVSFIEQPQYRLAGAEEALSQITERVKTVTEDFESNQRDKRRLVSEAYARSLQLIGSLGNIVGLTTIGSRKHGAFVDSLEALKDYAKARFKMLLHDQTLAVYRALLGHLPEYFRDIAFCRNRLDELGKSIGETSDPAVSVGCGKYILPEGCKNLDDAADKMLATLSPEDLLSFDQAIQKETFKRFRGVANVCLKPERSSDFLRLLATRSREFLDARLENVDPATIFLRYQGEGESALNLLAEGYESAAPDVTVVNGSSPMESAIFAAPAGDAGTRVREIVSEACPDAEFIPAPIADDLLILRETPRVELGALPQLAEMARESYEHQLTVEMTPHSRSDIPWSYPGVSR